jgi:hypothetical protein
VEADAMGEQTRKRTYSDANIFLAKTTQSKVMGRTLDACNNQASGQVCFVSNEKYSYAIPLEIIYLTPLSEWNPHQLVYHGDDATANAMPTASGETGADAAHALAGTSGAHFYRTPSEFFMGGEVNPDPADTSGGDVWVADPSGTPQTVRASGHRIMLPEIDGVGKLRQRWPILHVYAEGNTMKKELDGLKDIILQPSIFTHMYHEDISGGTVPVSLDSIFMTGPSTVVFGRHQHRISLTPKQMQQIGSSGTVTKIQTEQADGHTHDLNLALSSDGVSIEMLKCDQTAPPCFDGHTGQLIAVN